MKVGVRKIGSISVVDLGGTLTIGDPQTDLKDKVTELLDSGQKSIVLNLEKLSYMDSSGMGELIACHKRTIEKGGMLKLIAPPGRVFDLLLMTKLERVFDTFKEEKEALASFAS